MPTRVAVIDSGKGGRFLAEELATVFPQVEFYCVTDEVNVPYGEKSPEELKKCGLLLLENALAQKPDVVIVACHTLSSWCFPELETSTSVPVWSVNEALLAEILTLPAGTSLTLWGTTKTIQSNWFQLRIARQRPDLHLTVQACPELATAIEQQNDAHIEALLDRYLENLHTQSLALGCTHYPILTPQLQGRFAGSILDSQAQLEKKLRAFTQSSRE